jgi:hypothetical protein
LWETRARIQPEQFKTPPAQESLPAKITVQLGKINHQRAEFTA